MDDVKYWDENIFVVKSTSTNSKYAAQLMSPQWHGTATSSASGMLSAKHSVSGLHDRDVCLQLAQRQHQRDVEHTKVKAAAAVYGRDPYGWEGGIASPRRRCRPKNIYTPLRYNHLGPKTGHKSTFTRHSTRLERECQQDAKYAGTGHLGCL